MERCPQISRREPAEKKGEKSTRDRTFQEAFSALSRTLSSALTGVG
jgi:hypothetical protein